MTGERIKKLRKEKGLTQQFKKGNTFPTCRNI